MNVLFEEDGSFKVGTVLSETDASMQVEAASGKRVKVKRANVLLGFNEGGLADFLERAHATAEEIEVDFLWEVCGAEEFGFADLAAEYYGRAPVPVEAAGVLLRLHSAPIYFHRKGRGRFRAAPEETLKAALAGLERKRRQAEQIAEWAEMLNRSELPEAFRPILPQLLYKPDRNRIETKALEAACEETGLTAPKLLARCGALPSTHDYHLGRFLFEHFPRGIEFPELTVPEPPADLPRAEVQAFSLDDATTTEIDDAFSVTWLDERTARVGIHIAAPGLAISPGSPIDTVARERLSTAYMPGTKITMLPPAVIERFTLAEGRVCPAVSLYVDVDRTSFTIRDTDTRLENVPIAANLRHHEVDELNARFEAGNHGEGHFVAELWFLYGFARAQATLRGKGPTGPGERVEYSFYVEDDRVRIEPRKRGAPLDILVAELMILANSSWGRLLDERGAAAIYRAQGPAGRVRMTTAAAEHQGLGVSHYAWSTSPLRRYVDLVNQWQLLAVLRGGSPPFAANSETLLAALRDFEVTYAAYDEFQRQMEHYWCLRWLLQEKVSLARTVVVRDNLVKFADLPLFLRVPSLPDLEPGVEAVVEVAEVDLIDTQVRCVYKKAQQQESA
ncbi:MAG: RNB domain-containing ribonuclease [Betaproteobacteria bacterium]|nr:RNB domain-containing ribonuclease [Betaproteobacteria bacterium]